LGNGASVVPRRGALAQCETCSRRAVGVLSRPEHKAAGGRRSRMKLKRASPRGCDPRRRASRRRRLVALLEHAPSSPARRAGDWRLRRGPWRDRGAAQTTGVAGSPSRGSSAVRCASHRSATSSTTAGRGAEIESMHVHPDYRSGASGHSSSKPPSALLAKPAATDPADFERRAHGRAPLLREAWLRPESRGFKLLLRRYRFERALLGEVVPAASCEGNHRVSNQSALGNVSRAVHNGTFGRVITARYSMSRPRPSSELGVTAVVVDFPHAGVREHRRGPDADKAPGLETSEIGVLQRPPVRQSMSLAVSSSVMRVPSARADARRAVGAPSQLAKVREPRVGPLDWPSGPIGA